MLVNNIESDPASIDRCCLEFYIPSSSSSSYSENWTEHPPTFGFLPSRFTPPKSVSEFSFICCTCILSVSFYYLSFWEVYCYENPLVLHRLSLVWDCLNDTSIIWHY